MVKGALVLGRVLEKMLPKVVKVLSSLSSSSSNTSDALRGGREPVSVVRVAPSSQ